MLGYLLLAGALTMAAAPPGEEVAGERFASASANLALDRIRANIHQLHAEPGSRTHHPQLTLGIKKSLDDIPTALGEERSAEIAEVQWDTRDARYAKKSGTQPKRREQIKPLELVTGLAKSDAKQAWLKLAEKVPAESLSKRQKEMLAALVAEYKDRK